MSNTCSYCQRGKWEDWVIRCSSLGKKVEPDQTACSEFLELDAKTMRSDIDLEDELVKEKGLDL